MSNSSEAGKENERKEKRVSLSSPSVLLSPASRVVHKKARVSAPFELRTNVLAAGDVKAVSEDESDELKVASHNEPAGPGSGTPVKTAVSPPASAIEVNQAASGELNAASDNKGSPQRTEQKPGTPASVAARLPSSPAVVNEAIFEAAKHDGATTAVDGESFHPDNTMVGDISASGISNLASSRSPGAHADDRKISSAEENVHTVDALEEENTVMDKAPIEGSAPQAPASAVTQVSGCVQTPAVEKERGNYMALVADPYLDASAVEISVLNGTFDASSMTAMVLPDADDDSYAATIKKESHSFAERHLPTDLPGVASVLSPSDVCMDGTKISSVPANMEISAAEVNESFEYSPNTTIVEGTIEPHTSTSFRLNVSEVPQNIAIDGEQPNETRPSDATQEDPRALKRSSLSQESSEAERLIKIEPFLVHEEGRTESDNGAHDGKGAKFVAAVKAESEETDGGTKAAHDVGEDTSQVEGSVSKDKGASPGSVEGGDVEMQSYVDKTTLTKARLSGECLTAEDDSAEPSPDVVHALSEKKRRVRASLATPPSTPSGLLSFARKRIDDYSFRINEAYCDNSQLCDNCYALRVELENITEKLSTLSAEHAMCKVTQDVGQSSLECVNQLKEELVSVNDEIVRLTSENARLRQNIAQANVEVAQSEQAGLEESENKEGIKVDKLRSINAQLTRKNDNLAKDLDDYKFIMEKETRKWMDAANDFKRQVMDLECQLESCEAGKSALEATMIQLKAQYDADLSAAKQRQEREAINAKAIVDKNTSDEMDRLRKEVLLLSGQLAEERSNNERAEATLVSHEREQLLCNVFAAEISNLAADECEVLRRKVEELESKLTEAANGAEVACKEEENAEALKRKVAELESQLAQSADRIERSAGFEKELNDLKTKLAELQLELQGECEAKEIVQDALKASEEMKNELAGQLVKVEEASAYEISQLRKQITELKQQLNGLWDEGNRAERQAANQEDTLSSEIQQNETLPEQLRCELDRLAAEKAKVVKENEQRKQLIEQLQKEHVELVDQLGQKERELSGYLEKEAHQKAALTKEIDLLREQLSDIVHRTAASVSEAIRVEFDRESKEKGSEIERLDGLKRKLEEEAEKLRASLQQTKVEKENSDRKCEQLQQELDSVRKAAEDAKTTLQDQLKDVKADFERTLQLTISEWEKRVEHWRNLSESKESILQDLADSVKSQAAQLVKTTVEQKTEWLEKRAAQSDAELELLKEELGRTKQLAANEYSSMREKEEKLLALTIEANELKIVLKGVNGEKESLERRLEEAAVDLGKARELEEAAVQRAKVAEDVANGKAVELEQRIYALEGELLKAKESKEVLTKELAAQQEATCTLKGLLKSADEKLDLEKKHASARLEQMRKESDKQKGELEALKVSSQQSASLEKELSAIRAEREATIMKLKITLSEAEAKYDSTKSALDEATRRIQDLEVRHVDKLTPTDAPVQSVPSKEQDEEETEEMRRRIVMLERENERMARACDEADDEIKNLREELLELKEKMALMEGLSKEEVAVRLGCIRPPIVQVSEETIQSTFAAGNDGTPPKMTSKSDSVGSKIKSPMLKTKTSKKDEAAEAQQSCRTQ